MARICARCGQENPDGAGFCNKCGRTLLTESEQAGVCPRCGGRNPPYAAYCAHCGAGPLPARPAEEPERSYDSSYALAEENYWGPQRSSSGLLTVGLIMMILCGIASLGGGILIAAMGGTIGSFDASIGGQVVLCGMTICVLGIVALAGAISGFRLENFFLVIVGSVLGLIGAFLAFGILGLIPGILAVIFVALAYDDFEH